ncbi:sulfurtransferase [Rhodoferax aquaticus]|uniref:Sulfurtransferase n=1 Tax=Rhodoferax aquaticus TaxID=2527691 RepID=A0A515ERG8_9BURK|nr:sulfurtransferase [Rhodoferax aquaticus]QDL55266.1 sulfurtransferase [Rhodoferax aquaticus]
MYTTLITAKELKALQLSGTPYMVFDCSFDMGNPGAGAEAYATSHIAGAVYAHLDKDLSAKGDPALTGAASGGRHPLPSRENFAQWLQSMGFSNGMQAVVYDRQACHYCARLWWMLKWAGHKAVAVLDGGWPAWLEENGAVASGATQADTLGSFALGPALATLVDVHTVHKNLGNTAQQVLDARGAPRYRGDVEPLDPVAGHIPGALNRPFTENLTQDGYFKPADRLRAEFAQVLGLRDANSIVHHCGSGVTATPNVLAMEIAGFGRTALFAGSWSEWCSDPARPVAKG